MQRAHREALAEGSSGGFWLRAHLGFPAESSSGGSGYVETDGDLMWSFELSFFCRLVDT